MIFVDKIFVKNDFEKVKVVKGEFENCTFKGCDFSEFDMEGTLFNECRFISCNLSLAKIKGSAFRVVEFKECKLLGLIFESTNQNGFSVTFSDCFLSHSSFFGMRLKKIIIRDSNMAEVDFTDCDLTGAIMQNCDFNGATFNNTNLENADFRSAKNFSINPLTNRIKGAHFSLPSVISLLEPFDIKIDNL